MEVVKYNIAFRFIKISKRGQQRCFLVNKLKTEINLIINRM